VSSSVKSVHVRISGRVQGVGFRSWTKAQARKKALNGWVRNRTDGTVEAVFSGKESVVDEMVEACQDGPLVSRVKEVKVQSWDEPVASGFEHLETV
jgi:acylphosphatase